MTHPQSITPAQRRKAQLNVQRRQLLKHIQTLLDKPMIALSFFWIVLVILSLTTGLDPLWNTVSNIIWGIFIVDFLFELMIAPRKLRYLKRHWLVAVSLIAPALRLLRFVEIVRLLRLAQATESLRLVNVIGAVNRGMAALDTTIGRRRIGYVLGLTSLVTLIGAAGMLSFESQSALRQSGYASAVQQGAGFTNYGDALWYTAMLMTTLGSQYWPITAPGRILTFLLALYAFSIFGYITATIASYFVGKDSQDSQQQQQQQQQDVVRQATRAENEQLRQELAALRREIQALTQRLEQQPPSRPSPREPAPLR